LIYNACCSPQRLLRGRQPTLTSGPSRGPVFLRKTIITSYPLDVTLEVCASGFLCFIGLFVLFGLNRKGLPSGFRLLPASAQEWLIYYFHTFEAVTLVGLWICGIDRGRYIPWAFLVTLAASAIVFVSALVVWRWDHRLCYRELGFCLVAFLLAALAFPTINAVS
jgi:hypothetical protein